MSARILLVTGSRVLEGSEHEERAKALLSAFFELCCPSLVVVGDAGGPDEWAVEKAVSIAAAARIYGVDGVVRGASGKAYRAWSKGGPTSPLDRNAAMVRETAAQRAKGAHVEVFGLEATWSGTRGTAHTLGKARAAGLAITRITFERSSER